MMITEKERVIPWATPTSIGWKTSLPEKITFATSTIEDFSPPKMFEHMAINKVDWILFGSYQVDPSIAQDFDILVYDPDHDILNRVIDSRQYGNRGSLTDGLFSSWSYNAKWGLPHIFNVTITHDKELFLKSQEAQAIVEEYHMVDKRDRVTTFEFVRQQEGCLSPEKFMKFLEDVREATERQSEGEEIAAVGCEVPF